MRIEDSLRDLIVERYGSAVDFANDVGIPNSTLANVLKNGIGRTSLTNVFKICDALGISADALARGKIMPLDKSKKTEHLEDILSDMKLRFKNNNITLDKLPLNDMEKEILTVSIEVGIQTIRGRRK